MYLRDACSRGKQRTSSSATESRELQGGQHLRNAVRGASFPEGGPIFLGKIAWGCQISWGAKFPATPAAYFQPITLIIDDVMRY